MYMINKIVGWMASPMGIAIILLAAGLLCLLMPKRRRRLGIGFIVAAIVCLWVFGSSFTVRALEWGLEREFPVLLAEEMPQADAIVLLGGGMTSARGKYPYADMASAADRVWHAARLYKAGKAPIVIPTGCLEQDSTVPLLRDFGVPEDAIRVENEARNTEENARFVEKLLADSETKKVLLVTSAWHMRRSLLMYKRYAPQLDVIPAATDYEMEARPPLGTVVGFLRDIVPDADAFMRSTYLVKEYVGYWGYRLLRR